MSRSSVKMIEAARQGLMDHAPASLRHIPDGVKADNKWYQTALGHCRVWLWNFPRGYFYHSDVFKEMMPNRLVAKLNTPVIVSTFLTTVHGGRTLRVSNVAPDDCDSIGMPEHDNSFWYKCKESDGMKLSDLVEHTAAIPLLFKSNKWKWGDFKGHATVDGGVSSGFGGLEYCVDDCIIFVGTYDFPPRDVPKPPRPNWAALPWIGYIFKIFQMIGGMVNDNCFDDMQVVKQMEARYLRDLKLSKKKFVSSVMMPCESARKEHKLPTRFDFRKHTPDIVSKQYEIGLGWAEEHWDKLTKQQKLLMAQKGFTLVGMGGSTNGIFQAAVYAHHYEKTLEIKEKLIAEGVKCNPRVINLLTGDSCGGLSACFFANLQDLDEAGKLHLVMESS